jgi:hypothetical protein
MGSESIGRNGDSGSDSENERNTDPHKAPLMQCIIQTLDSFGKKKSGFQWLSFSLVRILVGIPAAEAGSS